MADAAAVALDSDLDESVASDIKTEPSESGGILMMRIRLIPSRSRASCLTSTTLWSKLSAIGSSHCK
jgi:hypothetical protein